ncbi:MAG TPA: hypothetical protein DCL21_07190 [Alphaproteobacteria bacterium]|nr:hypothetical protein [Alphaproteobacteria bacterium]
MPTFQTLFEALPSFKAYPSNKKIKIDTAIRLIEPSDVFKLLHIYNEGIKRHTIRNLLEHLPLAWQKSPANTPLDLEDTFNNLYDNDRDINQHFSKDKVKEVFYEMAYFDLLEIQHPAVEITDSSEDSNTLIEQSIILSSEQISLYNNAADNLVRAFQSIEDDDINKKIIKSVDDCVERLMNNYVSWPQPTSYSIINFINAEAIPASAKRNSELYNQLSSLNTYIHQAFA